MMHFRHHGNGKMVPDVKIILRGDSVIKKEMIAMLLAGGQEIGRASCRERV